MNKTIFSLELLRRSYYILNEFYSYSFGKDLNESNKDNYIFTFYSKIKEELIFSIIHWGGNFWRFKSANRLHRDYRAIQIKYNQNISWIKY